MLKASKYEASHKIRGRIYLETSVGTWRAFRCVLGESGKMGMIQLRQEGRPHDLADCTQFYPVD